jgi:hypothetical protein
MTDDDYDEITGLTDLTPEEIEMLLWLAVIGGVAGAVWKLLVG